MEPFSIIMFVFAVGLLLTGLYLFTGHKNELLLWKSTNKNPSKEYLRYMGKVTMFTALSPLLSGLSACLIGEESPLPYILLVITLIGCPIFGALKFRGDREK